MIMCQFIQPDGFWIQAYHYRNVHIHMIIIVPFHYSSLLVIANSYFNPWPLADRLAMTWSNIRYYNLLKLQSATCISKRVSNFMSYGFVSCCSCLYILHKNCTHFNFKRSQLVPRSIFHNKTPVYSISEFGYTLHDKQQTCLKLVVFRSWLASAFSCNLLYIAYLRILIIKCQW